jgi:hypothetical protein
MASSVAVLWIGPTSYQSYAGQGYTFGPIPQVGQRDDFQRGGESKLAATNSRRVITLHGHFTGANLNAIQAKVAAMRVALKKEEQVLYYHDGTSAQINNEKVVVESIDIPLQWGQYHTDYTIVLSYIPLDDVHKAQAIVSYGAFVFCDLTSNITKPMPVIGREMKVERQSPDAVPESSRVTLTLSGFFEEGTITANLAKIAALQAALAVDSGTLVYGSFSQSVKVLGFRQYEDTLQRRIGYTIQFMYTETARDNGIIKLSSMRRVSRVTQRYVAHLVPFLDWASVQLLGRGAQKIAATGYVICDSIADARMAAQLEIAAQFPVVNTPPNLVETYGATYSGVEDPSSNVSENAEQCRVDWSVERFYSAPSLAGAAMNYARMSDGTYIPVNNIIHGLYGTGL